MRTSDLTTLVMSSRPLSWINTAFGFAAAYWLTTREVDLALVVGTLFFLIPYNYAMYGLNDVFDYPSDVRNPRKGGVEGALLAPRLHRVTVVTSVASLVPFVVVLLAVGSPLAAAVLAVSVFAVVAYSVPPMRTKERPVLDSFTSAVHFVSPVVYGLVLAGAEWTSATWCVVVAFTLWGMASHAFGAVQDIVPDREGGLSSIATVLGAAWTVRCAIGAWLASGVVLLAAGTPVALFAPVALPYVLAVLPHRNLTDADSGEARRGWAKFLTLNYAVGAAVTIGIIALL